MHGASRAAPSTHPRALSTDTPRVLVRRLLPAQGTAGGIGPGLYSHPRDAGTPDGPGHVADAESQSLRPQVAMPGQQSEGAADPLGCSKADNLLWALLLLKVGVLLETWSPDSGSVVHHLSINHHDFSLFGILAAGYEHAVHSGNESAVDPSACYLLGFDVARVGFGRGLHHPPSRSSLFLSLSLFPSPHTQGPLGAGRAAASACSEFPEGNQSLLVKTNGDQFPAPKEHFKQMNKQ